MTTPLSAIADRWDISRLVGVCWRLPVFIPRRVMIAPTLVLITLLVIIRLMVDEKPGGSS